MTAHVSNHPLIKCKPTLMRDKNTASHLFRQLVQEVTMLLCYELTSNLDTELCENETPLETTQSQILSGGEICLISILRAGEGMLNGALKVMPNAEVGHIGLYRNHVTLEAIEYYYNVPTAIKDMQVIIIDPMLGTANTAVAAISRLKQSGVNQIRFACLLASPIGMAAIEKTHSDVDLYIAEVDRELNECGYLLPGLGEVGDRIFGTY